MRPPSTAHEDPMAASPESGSVRATRELSTQLVALAARHGLDVDGDDLRINEAGLDYRVAFARTRDGTAWVLRVPRRPEVSAKLAEERRILEFVAPRLSVAVPVWQVCSEELVAYRRLPGEPGLTLDENGQPIWHFDPSSPDFAAALGRLIAELQAVDGDAAAKAGVPVLSADQLRAQWRTNLETVRAELAIAPHLLDRWHAWLGDDTLWPTTTAFSHGELYAAHVLVEGSGPRSAAEGNATSIDTPGRIVGVLDWTTAKVGDPAIDFTYQHMMGPAAFDATVAAYLEAGGSEPPRLADRCAELAAAAPLLYGLYALQTRDPQHLATASAQLVAPPADP
jgi:aminoglycoside phosphotransferase (APT) family kinase protein